MLMTSSTSKRTSTIFRTLDSTEANSTRPRHVFGNAKRDTTVSNHPHTMPIFSTSNPRTNPLPKFRARPFCGKGCLVAIPSARQRDALTLPPNKQTPIPTTVSLSSSP